MRTRQIAATLWASMLVCWGRMRWQAYGAEHARVAMARQYLDEAQVRRVALCKALQSALKTGALDASSKGDVGLVANMCFGTENVAVSAIDELTQQIDAAAARDFKTDGVALTTMSEQYPNGYINLVIHQ